MAKTVKSVAVVAGFVAVLGLAFYPIYFYPKSHLDEYREQQRAARSKIPAERVQPRGMKEWADPFNRKKPGDA